MVIAAQRFKLLIRQTQLDRRTQTQSHKTMETHESTLVWDRFVSRKNESCKNAVYHRISKISLSQTHAILELILLFGNTSPFSRHYFVFSPHCFIFLIHMKTMRFKLLRCFK